MSDAWRRLARQAVGAADVVPVKGALWRGHQKKYGAIDHGGSLLYSGRFHRAAAEHPAGISWPALYTALDLAVALGEIQRTVSPERIDTYRFTELWAQFDAVLDCHDPARLGMSLDHLLDDGDYSLSQTLAAAARDLGVEGLLVPSATRLGDNLIVFPDRLRSGSVLVEVRSIDPKLVKTQR